MTDTVIQFQREFESTSDISLKREILTRFSSELSDCIREIPNDPSIQAHKEVFKIFRSVDVREFQDIIRIDILGSCVCALYDTLISETANSCLSIIFSLTQLISLSTTANDQNQNYLYEYKIKDTEISFFKDILNLLLQVPNRKILTVTCCCVYNNIANNSTVRHSFFRQRSQLVHLLDHIYTSRDNDKVNPTDSCSEWIYFIFIKYFETELNNSGSNDLIKLIEDHFIQTDQLNDDILQDRLLHLLEIMDVYSGKKADKKGNDEIYGSEEVLVMNNVAQSALTILKLYFYLIYKKTQIKNDSDEMLLQPTESFENVNNITISYKQFESMFVCIEVIANVTISESQFIQSNLGNNKLIELVTDMMKVASMSKDLVVSKDYKNVRINQKIFHQTHIPVVSKLDYNSVISGDVNDQEKSEEDDQMFYGYRSNLIRVMGNACYSHQQNQDLIRTHGGIPLILNHCGVDYENPYLREWSVLCLRNVCEDNLKNQELILKYQAVKVDKGTQDMMDQAGVKINMNPNTAKVEVHKTEE
ncbi:hypothetical protein AKO1_010685 [Acrasis kona]|uniref:Ataxin-10 domain-containing protein n=1 Tax=Acrasis kona TaxID=1008807 RepID=A0AAW2ZIS7_9EUKA